MNKKKGKESHILLRTHLTNQWNSLGRTVVVMRESPEANERKPRGKSLRISPITSWNWMGFSMKKKCAPLWMIWNEPILIARWLLDRSVFVVYFQRGIVWTPLTKDLLCSDIINTGSRSIDENYRNVFRNIFNARLIRLNDWFFRPTVPRCQGLKTNITTSSSTRIIDRWWFSNDLPRLLNIDMIKILIQRFGSLTGILNRR